MAIRWRRISLVRTSAPAPRTTVWASDITYIPTGEGWLYLAVILDLFTRKVVGWAMREHMRAELTMAALTMAIQRRRPGPGLVHHSDRGSQYAAGDYRKILQAATITQSMSRKGNCWDNAPMESFFGTLKTELVSHEHYATRADARASVFEYIEVFYNRQRLHSSLGYVSPDGLRARSYKRRLTATELSRAGATAPDRRASRSPCRAPRSAAPQHSCTDASPYSHAVDRDQLAGHLPSLNPVSTQPGDGLGAFLGSRSGAAPTARRPKGSAPEGRAWNSPGSRFEWDQLETDESPLNERQRGKHRFCVGEALALGERGRRCDSRGGR